MAALLAAGALAENLRQARLRGHRAWLTAIPVVLVNFVAFYGQLSYFRANRVIHAGAGSPVVIPVPVSMVMALALESIAIYLAWQAHVARKSHDSALRLRLAAYAVAALIGALNYSHFCGPGWKPNAYAVAFAFASLVSPALWGVHSNRESRDSLKAQGLIEDHAVRLGLTRWFWYPRRSACVQRLAAWAGESRIDRAIALWEARREARRERKNENGRGAGTGARPVTAAGPAAPASAESPVSRRKTREPRTQAVRAARVPELAAAPAAPAREPHAQAARAAHRLGPARAAAERELATELAHTAQPWPSARKLADDERLSPFGSLATRRRAADRAVVLAKTMSNGAGHGDQHRA